MHAVFSHFEFITLKQVKCLYSIRLAGEQIRSSCQQLPRGFNHFVIRDLGGQISAKDLEGDFSALETYLDFGQHGK